MFIIYWYYRFYRYLHNIFFSFFGRILKTRKLTPWNHWQATLKVKNSLSFYLMVKLLVHLFTQFVSVSERIFIYNLNVKSQLVIFLVFKVFIMLLELWVPHKYLFGCVSKKSCSRSVSRPFFMFRNERWHAGWEGNIDRGIKSFRGREINWLYYDSMFYLNSTFFFVYNNIFSAKLKVSIQTKLLVSSKKDYINKQQALEPEIYVQWILSKIK